MQLRGLAPTTQRSYLHYVSECARYFKLGPEHLDLEAVRQFQLHLLEERKLSPESVNTYVSAVQFLYLETLGMPWKKEDFPRTRKPQKLPVVLAPDQVRRLFDFIPGVKNRMALMLCFGAGLRVSEAAAFKTANIDSACMLLRVELGKGGKDRYTMLSPALLEVLRIYYRVTRPAGDWLFPSWHPSRHISPGVLQRACSEAWQAASPPESFRYCWATAISQPPRATQRFRRLKSPPPPVPPSSSWQGRRRRRRNRSLSPAPSNPHATASRRAG
jgi:integrase/recombinase XerD